MANGLTIRCAALLVASAMLSTASPRIVAQGLTLAAVAADVQCAVLRSEDGQLHRYAPGDAIADTGWKLRRIVGQDAVFADAKGLRGSALELRLGIGAHVDLKAVGEATADLRRVQRVPIATTVHAQARRKPKR